MIQLTWVAKLPQIITASFLRKIIKLDLGLNPPSGTIFEWHPSNWHTTSYNNPLQWLNVLTWLMFWYGQCFAQSNACRRATIHVGPQISTSPVHWRHPNTDRAKILTTPKHRQCWPEGPARYCENDQVCASPFSFHALSLSLKEIKWRIRGNRSTLMSYSRGACADHANQYV